MTKLATTILHGDRQQPDQYRAVHRPIHVSTAYGHSDPADLIKLFQGGMAGYIYGRQGNPTTAGLENKLTLMDGGIASATFSTGWLP